MNAVVFSPDGSLLASASDDERAATSRKESMNNVTLLLHADPCAGEALTPVGLHISGRTCMNKRLTLMSDRERSVASESTVNALKFCYRHEATTDKWQVGFLSSRRPRSIHVGSHARRGVRGGSGPTKSWGCDIHVDFRYFHSRQLLWRHYARRIDEPRLL